MEAFVKPDMDLFRLVTMLTSLKGYSCFQMKAEQDIQQLADLTALGVPGGMDCHNSKHLVELADYLVEVKVVVDKQE